jgi:stearoyl-CoA desaturase (Delta-9 desaturase)
VHHKFIDTDADPYNASRGFFFSHIGWLLIRKHPDVKNKGATVDCSDVAQDPFVAFQRKYDGHCLFSQEQELIRHDYLIDSANVILHSYFFLRWYLYLTMLCCFIIPVLIPWLVWNESLWYSWHITAARFALNLNQSWFVNSAAHMWGMKPFNKYVIVQLLIYHIMYVLLH